MLDSYSFRTLLEDFQDFKISRFAFFARSSTLGDLKSSLLENDAAERKFYQERSKQYNFEVDGS